MKKGVIIAIVVGAIGGVIMGIFSDQVAAIFGGVTFFQAVLAFFMAFYFSIWFHEMGHAITFTRLGVPIRAVIVLGFSCVKRDGRWKIKFSPALLKMMGGIAVPEISEIYSHEELEVMQDRFAKALYYGPYTSILYTLAIVLSTILLYLLDYSIAFMLWLNIFNIFLLVLVIISSNMENEILIGDYRAHDRARSDSFFVAQMMYQYKYFSDRKDIEQKYLNKYLLDELEHKLELKDTHAYTLSAVDLLLVEGMIDGHIPDVVKRYMHMLSDDIFKIKRYIGLEGVKNLVYHMIAFYRLAGDDRADMLYDIVKHNGGKSDTDQYLLRQVDHIMGEKDERQFLSDSSNVNMSSLQMLYDEFEGFGRLEDAYNQVLIARVSY